MTRESATYQASHLLMGAGYSIREVGRALLALEGRHDDGQAELEQDPAEWGPEWDEYVWVPTDPSYEPSEDEVTWLNEQPTTDDLAELEAWLSHLSEGYPREYPDPGYLSDRDVMTATGCAG